MQSENDFIDRLLKLDSVDAMVLTATEITRTGKDPSVLEFVRGVRWFLQTGSLPSNLQSWQVPLLRFFAAELVNRKLLKPTALDLFPEKES